MSGELVVPVLLACEDCGGEVEPGVGPIGLFRPVPGAPAIRRGRKRVGRRGGRRWREYLLCRRCRGEALRQRSLNGTTTEAGVKRALRRRERLGPKKGGRPRLLTDEQLRAAHVLYDREWLSMRQLAEKLHQAGHPGTVAGLASALHLGFRRLELTVRAQGLTTAYVRFGTDGTKSKPQKRPCVGVVKHGPRAGKRCRQWAMKEKLYCVDHQAR